MATLSLLFASALLFLAGASAQNTLLFITAPNVFRASVDETVEVALYRPTGVNVEVEIYLKLPNSADHIDVRNVVVSSAQHQAITLRIEPGSLARNEGRYQHVILGARSLHPNHPFEQEKEVLVTLQSGFVFVQTDKPIYTPNQMVKVRVMSLDQNMLPSDRQLHVEVTNPRGITVTRFKETQATNGFLTGTFQFSSHPMEGIWTVTAFYGHEFALNSTVTFEVTEYVLPTFSVKIRPPRYILEGDSEVVTEIDAQYVFGKPVLGRYIFKFGVVESDGSVQELGERRGNLDHLGHAVVTLSDLENVFGADWFDEFIGRRFHVEAIVEEASTSFSEATVNREAIFVTSPYKVSAKRTAQFFKKALPVHIKLDVTYANGVPAADVAVNITVKATLTGGAVVDLGEGNDGNSREADEYGRIDFLRSVPVNAENIEVQCTTNDPDLLDINQATLSFQIGAYQSPNGADSVVIIPRVQEANRFPLGNQAQFTVQRSAGQGAVDLQYMCVTAGKMVCRGSLPNVGNAPVLDILITQEMVPSTWVVVYFITDDGHVIADSLHVDVQESCGGEVSLHPPERPLPLAPTFLPNNQLTIQVRAPPLSWVSLLGVDKAVYLLRDKDQLTSDKMFKRMSGYDIGCGPGGGGTSADIFKNSGLTVLTDPSSLDVPRREDIGCSDAGRRKRRNANIGAILRCNTEEITACLAQLPNLRNALENQDWTCRRQARALLQNCDLSPEARDAYEFCCVQDGLASGRSGEEAAIDEDVSIREDFRETWFFDLLMIPEDGAPYDYSVFTPGSITEWQLTAVSVSPTLGMCVDTSTSLTVFQNFFIHLHLPYSVVRLEQTEVVVTVFNYRFQEMEVKVMFQVEDGLCTDANPANRTIFIEPQNAKSTTFVVRPVEVGLFAITVSAVGPGRRNADIIRKDLRVVAQGVTKTKGISVTLDPGRVNIQDGEEPEEDNSDITVLSTRQEDSQTEHFTVSLPEDAIPETESCSVSLIGNLLGTIVTDPIGGIDHLIRQPTGCGEQTMLKLAPTLFVYKYLHAVNADTAHIEEKVYDYLADGINRELTFRLDNGAFSVWHSNYPGSTWLTAFVIKVFSQASQFTRVTPGHVASSIDWLIDSNQRETGVFEENYRVHHQEMIGGVKGDFSMTAFVLISLLESRNLLIDSNEKIDQAINLATMFLETELENIDRVYDKAIVTYALALADSAHVTEANRRLMESAEEDPDSKDLHFDPNPDAYAQGQEPYWLLRRPSAISIEITAYALLAQMRLHDYGKAGKMAVWLSKQQTYHGGFVSTQDTVVALQALAKYAERPEFDNINLDCRVSYEKDPTFQFEHHIGNDNAKVQEEVSVTESIGERLRVRSSGEGVARANVELRYNTEKGDEDVCPFNISINATEAYRPDNSVDHLEISFCARYLNTAHTTHMSIIDLGLYSGFIAVTKDLKRIVNESELISSYELSDRSVVFYANEIPNDRSICFRFNAKPEAIVGNIQPVAVHVYDYYDPDETCTLFYKPNAESALMSTLCSESACVCSRPYCGTDHCGARYSQDVLEQTACASQDGYAHEILINDERSEGGFKIFDITVEVPLKKGLDNVAGSERRELYLNEQCSCPVFRATHKYLLVGDKGIKFIRPNGQEGFKYLYGEGSKAEYLPRRRKAGNAVHYDKLEEFKAKMLSEGCSNEVLG